ncbi:MAG: 16S rRNA (guanine(527)-N(7))-methyltransferase RsmG [Bacteroidales bacterium]|nr:16S rRNA (guanine(527)-N(7))-methyltransferase RsmG [Bacteroidales bacterium]MBQ9597570.1 16S rRNA (guanine(527)-N(7))-methyltransferase RsmG [Bacteroidales bacterium]
MDFRAFEQIITKKFLSLTNKQLDQFRESESLYREWNGKINVISRKDTDGLFAHHLLHSLCLAGYAQNRLSGKTILDVGTGGGFPGIPLAILYPESRFTLCDSIGKKTLVARSIAESLGLENVMVVQARAENLDDDYDFVVSRAVASLEDFLPWVKGKYRESVLLLKGGDINPEIAAACGRFRLDPGNIHTWPIDAWLSTGDFPASEQEDYNWFQNKFVVEL